MKILSIEDLTCIHEIETEKTLEEVVRIINNIRGIAGWSVGDEFEIDKLFKIAFAPLGEIGTIRVNDFGNKRKITLSMIVDFGKQITLLETGLCLFDYVVNSTQNAINKSEELR